MPSSCNKRENYNCMWEIMNVAVCEGLRQLFKQEWDKHYGISKGVWDDSPLTGNELYNMERTRAAAKDYLSLFKSGKRSDWDCSALTDAILYSKALKSRVSAHVSKEVNELRDLRNRVVHSFPWHKMSNDAFANACNKVKKCFNALSLSTADVERIANSRKGKNTTRFWKACICISIVILVLGGIIVRNELMKPPQNKTIFRVLPARPVHLVANRTRIVGAILEELNNLSARNYRSLTYFYISGNSGSGKSQLARLVGQRYGTNAQHGQSGGYFVMTLNGRSLNDLLESYANFARRMGCNETIIGSILNLSQTKPEIKINRLKVEIVHVLKNGEYKYIYTWLLIVDNVVKLSEISSSLPQLEDEDWQGGQVLITTQDMPSVPSNSSLTVHVSVSHGMDPTESREFLTNFSGLIQSKALMVNKVAEVLDYQPLALASAAF